MSCWGRVNIIRMLNKTNTKDNVCSIVMPCNLLPWGMVSQRCLLSQLSCWSCPPNHSTWSPCLRPSMWSRNYTIPQSSSPSWWALRSCSSLWQAARFSRSIAPGEIIPWLLWSLFVYMMMRRVYWLFICTTSLVDRQKRVENGMMRRMLLDFVWWHMIKMMLTVG